jgi:hypothetical protein
MSKLTQKELLQEGFLDTVRTIGRAVGSKITGKNIGKGLAKLAGGVGGAALGAVGNVAKNLLNPNSDLFSASYSGAKAGFKGGMALPDKLLNYIPKSPSDALKKELDTEYNRIFNVNTINIKLPKKDTTNPILYIIPFTATRIDITPALSGVFYGNVFEVEKNTFKYDVKVKDSQGQIISPQRYEEPLMKLTDIYKKLNFNPAARNTATTWLKLLKRGTRGSEKDLKTIITDIIPPNSDLNTYILTQADIDKLRQELKNEFLISEKKSQISTLQESFNILN